MYHVSCIIQIRKIVIFVYVCVCTTTLLETETREPLRLLYVTCVCVCTEIVCSTLSHCIANCVADTETPGLASLQKCRPLFVTSVALSFHWPHSFYLQWGVFQRLLSDSGFVRSFVCFQHNGSSLLCGIIVVGIIE